jgi:hypothetical protein
MIKESGQIIQAFPLGMSTNVYPSGVTSFEVNKSLIVHIVEDGDITLIGRGNTITVSVLAGSDWAIDRDVELLDVSSSCILT